MKRFLGIFAILQVTCAVVHGRQEWVERADITRSSVNVSFCADYRPKDGLHFRVASADADRTVTISLSRKKGEVEFEPGWAFPSAIRQASQFNLEAMPESESKKLRIMLKMRPEFWAIYVAERPVGFVPAAFLPPAKLLVPRDELPEEEKTKVKRQKTAGFYFEDKFLVPEDDENKLAEWEMLSGSWRLHSVKDVTRFTSGKMQAERSPNFYSLRGSGSNAMITAGHSFYDSYSLEAAVQVVSGEMGLVFYGDGTNRYHGFTVAMEDGAHEALLSLWRATSGGADQRDTLGAVVSPMTGRQWIKLRIRTFQNRVQCYVDNTLVLDVPVELPPGGKFGLFVNSKDGVRFDDVLARSNRDLDFRAVSDLKRHVLVEEGRFLPAARFFHLFPGNDSGEWLTPGYSRKPQYLVVGSVEHGPHVFSAEFEPSRSDYCVGLLSGFTAEDEPVLRFTCRGSRDREVFAVEEVRRGSTNILETTEIKSPGHRESFRLMADSTNEREVRLYRNDELVLVHHLAEEQKGASGVYVAPRTKTKISTPLYQFERRGLYHNQFEKNRAYVADPFMRHWSSPEGQWISDTNKLTWYKGDFFGRFVVGMPFIEKSEIHLGVGEDGESAVVVRAGISNIVLESGTDGAAENDVLARASVSELVAVEREEAKGKEPEKWYEIHYEGYWLWITSGENVLLKCRLPGPLTGRRMRIAGFTTEQLKYSHVDRFHVKDYLFTESLYDWKINGGRWETVNRFKCDTRWSHMNGESAKSLAALWTKYNFSGDFCMELYAGMRHGWYDRCGDLNITLLNRETTPGDGYTITCTGWDPDHSQRLTKFYRKGELIAQSDKYLVPRYRDGNKRRGYSPLVQKGRDVHGAWYYIKFRRIGKKLEYYFDNELVFSREDDKPLPAGSAGIWTFMNSMMVARVKIAAESIEPTPLAFAPVATESIQRAGAGEDDGGKRPVILAGGEPLDTCTPSNWEADDEVGELNVSWHEEPDVGPYFVAENVMGSGSMLVKSKLPAVKYTKLAGWRFFVKRTENARFNFHYSVGRLTSGGKFRSIRSFFHHISGTDFSEGLFERSGGTSVSPAETLSDDWHEWGEWAPVEVWVTQDISKAYPRDELYVQAVGFGNLQPSYILQGLAGNDPGEAYAVRDFVEIRRGTPGLSTADGGPTVSSLVLREQASSKTLAKASNLSDLQGEINSLSGGTYVSGLLEYRAGRDRLQDQLCWVVPSDKPPITCSWSEEYPSSVVLASGAPYPDPDLGVATVSVGVKVSEMIREPGRLVVPVPRIEELSEPQTSHVPVEVVANGTTNTFRLAWKDAGVADPPVLLKLEGPTPLFENFEHRSNVRYGGAQSFLRPLRHFDALQGTYLEVGNRGKLRRLKTGFSESFDLSRYPVFQFRYRGDVMSRVSASFGGKRIVHLSEPGSNAMKVGAEDGLILDGQWHSWAGFPSDAVVKRAFTTGFFDVTGLTIGSLGPYDQTGLFSKMDLDDVVVGPAVSKRIQLSFTPHYFDFGGVDRVLVALRSSSEPYTRLDEKERSVLVWEEVANGEMTVPNISELEDGLCHMSIKAVDAAGNESLVTDIPFLLDTRPPVASYDFKGTSEVLSNGSKLQLRFRASGGSPLDIGRLKVRWDKAEVEVEPRRSTISHNRSQDVLELEWPYIFRKQLNDTTNGQTGRIVISGIHDGAGNRSEDLVASLVVDYDKDKTPPTLLPAEMPECVLWSSGWDGEADGDIGFERQRGVVASLVQRNNEEPYLSVRSGKDYGDIWVEIDDWHINKHPYLTFRIRRPVIRVKDKVEARIQILMKTSGKGGLAVLPLNPAEKTEDGKKSERKHIELSLPEPIEWKTNEWHTVSLDLREVFGNDLPGWRTRSLRVRHLGIRVYDKSCKSPVHLQSMYVSRAWEEGDVVTLNAYDASGVDTSSWQPVPEIDVPDDAEGTNNFETTDDAATNSPVTHESTNAAAVEAEVAVEDVDDNPLWRFDEDGWLLGRVRDKAGNLSVHVRFPYRTEKSTEEPEEGDGGEAKDEKKETSGTAETGSEAEDEE